MRVLLTLAVLCLVGIALPARAVDPVDAWRAPFALNLPEPTRSISLKPRTDAIAFAASHGLQAARIVPMGRAGSVLEMPMDDAAWEQVQQSTCAAPEVAGCETTVCQGIQFAGSATPGGEYAAEAVQARLVHNPPETVNVPDEPDGEAGTCQGPPLVPPLDDTAAAGTGTGQSLNIDLTVLESDADGSGTGNVTAPEAGAATPEASGGTDASPPGPHSFRFNVNSRFNPAGGVDLGTDDLPADTSDWTLVVGAGCTEVKVPLSSLEPARMPGIVVALVDAGNVNPVATTYGLTVVRQIALPSTGQNLAVYATAQNIFTVIAAMAADARVDGAQPEYVFETTAEPATGAEPAGPAEVAGDQAPPLELTREALAPLSEVTPEVTAELTPEATPAAPLYSDPFAALNYGPGQTGALALQSAASGTGQLIAVIDTGIDVNHPDLAGRLREPVDTTDKGYAAEVHGTAVAGIIAAAADNAIGSYGVAPAAEILPIKACQPKEEGGLKARCTTSTLVKALDVAMTADAAIINMSLAGPPDDLVARFVDVALEQNRLIVAGAGNGGPNAKPGFPAAIPGVLAVTAVDVRDGLYDQANRGDYIDVAAPGVDIVASVPNGRYPPLSGTSMAAAHVSGVAALIHELGPLMSPREVGLVIRSQARDLGSVGLDPEFGAGLVDACRTAAAATADAVTCAQGERHGNGNAY